MKAKTKDKPEPIDKRGDADVDHALEAYFEAKETEKTAKGRKTEAENILKATIGDGEELIANHARVKWAKTARGRRFTVKAV